MTVLFNVVEHQILLMFIYLLFRVMIWTKKNGLFLRQVSTLKNISIQNFVILECDKKRYLAQVIEINMLQQKTIVQFYKQPLPHSFNFSIFTKMSKTSTPDWYDVIASLIVQSVIGRRGQLSLSIEQIIDIGNFVDNRFMDSCAVS